MDQSLSRKMPQLLAENAARLRLNFASFSLASELQNHENEVTTHEVKKGAAFDDESFIVRHGTEPIDRYGGWPESIHPRGRCSIRPSKFKSRLQFPNARKNLVR
jgi:hypothetical protein